MTRSTAWNRIGHSLAWLLTLALSAVLAVAVVVPRLGQGVPYVIETGSMRPGLPPGTLVVVRPADTVRLAVGTVITYQLRSGEPEVVTHRIVAQGVDATGQVRFRTQGDANNAADAGWVRPVQIKGERWYAVPLIGYVTSVVTEGQRHTLLLAIVAVLLCYAAAMVIGDLRDRRRSGSVVVS
jgi:signal peptidase